VRSHSGSPAPRFVFILITTAKGKPMRGLHRRNGRDAVRRAIEGAHLVWHGYGHWIPNDPRGSGSVQVRNPELEGLGPVHFGRKGEQPSREELRAFYRQVNPLLEFQPFWFDGRMRQAIGEAFGRAAAAHGYTLWALAVCSNHGHAVVRTHRDRSEVVWENLAQEVRTVLRATADIDPRHPVWSNGPYKVFLYTPEEVIGGIDYVVKNPEKEGLPRQDWPFVKPYPKAPKAPQ
jgi:REP element-mobilizing transposase RayT